MASIAPGSGFTNGVVPIRNQASISEVDKFCQALGGKKPIHSILIANNGMAAVKFIRSVRTWAYETFGSEKAILLVAMATPEDMRINAEHIRIADQFVEVPGGTNNNNYANVQLIVEVHMKSGCKKNLSDISVPAHCFITIYSVGSTLVEKHFNLPISFSFA